MYNKEFVYKHFTSTRRGKRKGCKQRKIELSVSSEYLTDLYFKQEGKCYYTGVDLKIEQKKCGTVSSNTLTIERLDPRKGYIEGNVALISYRANCSKSSLDAFLHDKHLTEDMKMSLLGRAFAHLSNSKRFREKRRSQALAYFSLKTKGRNNGCIQQ